MIKSNSEVDSVLGIEKKLEATTPADQRYAFVQRGSQMVRTFSASYCAAYQLAMPKHGKNEKCARRFDGGQLLVFSLCECRQT